MAKKCIVKRNEENVPSLVEVKNPNYDILFERKIRYDNLTELADKNVNEIREYVEYRRNLDKIRDNESKGIANPKSLTDALNNSKFRKINYTTYSIDMGYPTDILVSAGVRKDIKLKLNLNQLYVHILSQINHRIDVEDIEQIMRAVHNPIAIFENKGTGLTRTDMLEIKSDLKNKRGEYITILLQKDTFEQTRDKVLGKITQTPAHIVKTGFAMSYPKRLYSTLTQNDGKLLFINKRRSIDWLKTDRRFNEPGMRIGVIDYSGGEIDLNTISSAPKENVRFFQNIINKINSFQNELSDTQIVFHNTMLDKSLNRQEEVPSEVTDALILALEKSGIASRVVKATNSEIQSELIRLGVSADTIVKMLDGENVEVELKEQNIEITTAGFYNKINKEIWLNIESPTLLETSFHEFGHGYMEWLKEAYPSHYKKALTLIEKNKAEAENYINEIAQTQPNLKEGTEEWKNEVLAKVIGDNGAKLVKSAKKGSIREWLDEFWGLIKNFIGFSSKNLDDIGDMRLSDFANSVIADILDRNLQRTSLSTLEKDEMKELRGKKINPQTIRNFIKGKDIKKADREIIESVLNQSQFSGKKIDYDTFENAVKLQVLPLTKIFTDTYSDYGSKRVDLNDTYQRTIIFNSPINHGEYGHFKKDLLPGKDRAFTPISRETIAFRDTDENGNEIGPTKYYLEHLNDVVTEDDYTNEELDDLFMQENNYRKLEFDRVTNEMNHNLGLFGHVRIWLDDIYTVGELQSDVFQRNIKRIISETNPEYKNISDDINIKKAVIYVTEAGIEHIRKTRLSPNEVSDLMSRIRSNKNIRYKESTTIDEYGAERTIVDITIDNKNVSYDILRISRDLGEESFQLHLDENIIHRLEPNVEMVSKIKEKGIDIFASANSLIDEKMAEISKLNEEISDLKKKQSKIEFSNYENQMMLSGKFFELRLIREVIKDAADRGMEIVRFPTAYTASKIQGYLSGQVEFLDSNTPVIGEEVMYIGERYAIVDINDEGTLEILPIYNFQQTTVTEMQEAIAEDYFNRFKDSIYEEYGDEKDMFTYEELSNIEHKIPHIEDILNDMFQQKADNDGTSIQEVKIDLDYYKTDIKSEIEDKIDNDEIDDWLNEVYGIGYIKFTEDNDIYYTIDPNIRSTYVSSNEYKVDAENFDIKELDEEHQPIAKRYEGMQEILYKERGENNFNIVEDEEGNTWYETNITKQDKEGPVLAFNKVEKTTETNGEYINSELFDELKTEPFLEEEDALDIYKAIYSKDLNQWQNLDLNEC